jgi:hypothetical protein
VEQGIYFLFRDGIVETGVEWCAIGRHSTRVLLRSGRLAKHQEAGNDCESNERGEHVFLNSDGAVNQPSFSTLKTSTPYSNLL